MLPDRLTAVDQLCLHHHHYVAPGDQVFYFGEYTPRVGYGHSATNQFISNFKKPIDRRNKPDWQYKGHAIDQFTQSISAAIKESAIARDITFVPVPPSKVATDPNYDDRMWQVLCGLKRKHPSADCRQLVVQTLSTDPFHEATETRRLRPEELATHYSVVEDDVSAPRPIIAIVDDMLTTGSHFKAMEIALNRVWPGRQIIGLFAARRIPLTPVVDTNDF